MDRIHQALIHHLQVKHCSSIEAIALTGLPRKYVTILALGSAANRLQPQKHRISLTNVVHVTNTQQTKTQIKFK